MMRCCYRVHVAFVILLPAFYFLVPFAEQSNDGAGSLSQGSLVVKDYHANENYEKYYELEALQYLWNNSFIPQQGYPIPKERWHAVSNNTCVKSSSPQNTSILSWKGRPIPHAIIIGCQKCGSTAVASSFRSHPDVIAPNRELHFLSRFMDTGEIPGNDIQVSPIQMSSGSGIDQAYWQQLYYDYIKQFTEAMQTESENDTRTPNNNNSNNNQNDDDCITNDDAVTEAEASNSTTLPPYLIEKTPNYILLGDRVPQRLLCLSPWSKLILILRDPVDRAFSHYNMAYQGYHRRNVLHDDVPFPSFDEWIRRDYNVLVALGILQNDTDNAIRDDDQKQQQQQQQSLGYQGTLRERQGWAAYTKLAAIGTLGGLGRGLYSLQIIQWQEAYQIANQPLDLLVLSSDSTRSHPQQAFDRICDHLGISRHELEPETLDGNQRDYSEIPPMSNATRQWLERIYEPYNQQLANILGKQFWSSKQ
jgi:Sulfotransferase family